MGVYSEIGAGGPDFLIDRNTFLSFPGLFLAPIVTIFIGVMYFLNNQMKVAIYHLEYIWFNV